MRELPLLFSGMERARQTRVVVLGGHSNLDLFARVMLFWTGSPWDNYRELYWHKVPAIAFAICSCRFGILGFLRGKQGPHSSRGFWRVPNRVGGVILPHLVDVKVVLVGSRLRQRCSLELQLGHPVVPFYLFWGMIPPLK